jgi:hypothetical protein
VRESAYATRRCWIPAAVGWCAGVDRARLFAFCRMMLNGGALDGVQILSSKAVALFSLNYLPIREVADMAMPGDAFPS